MARPDVLENPPGLRRRLARPVRLVHRVSFWIFVVTLVLLVVGAVWLVWALKTGSVELALWQQLLVVLALVGLLGLGGLAFRIAFFARILRSVVE